MANKNKNNQPQTGANSMDTEFGAEQGMSKKARKKRLAKNAKTNNSEVTNFRTGTYLTCS
ncbi:hypothetical protein E1I69_19560 [Bacillus timonensis]|uniref:Uncharacterized protein n=1 Tax=Bacillus timonensis TaxID=1033734 RepID=A0A4V3V7A6_9BACI|nr:hypothetical protein [Bacillus timonensis]THE10263.1 hypothetical protein E1I69_19560 [Bacillus timonensis]